uniref:hypothetical protein 52 n=1 Tax=Moniliophthora perniciosa TaxID=153609 RepID=UPI0000242361|nr:hypothetical protein 52 [Moniliophthora perniciosa]AAQ74344.1 hypothetical protein 52 [Moniliophthora perniciosa]
MRSKQPFSLLRTAEEEAGRGSWAGCFPSLPFVFFFSLLLSYPHLHLPLLRREGKEEGAGSREEGKGALKSKVQQKRRKAAGWREVKQGMEVLSAAHRKHWRAKSIMLHP